MGILNPTLFWHHMHLSSLKYLGLYLIMTPCVRRGKTNRGPVIRLESQKYENQKSLHYFSDAAAVILFSSTIVTKTKLGISFWPSDIRGPREISRFLPSYYSYSKILLEVWGNHILAYRLVWATKVMLAAICLDISSASFWDTILIFFVESMTY